MSRAYQSFEYGIKDAEELLAHFDAINANPPPPNAEVLKRAGLVMALTAWETYVEDRLLEEMNKKIGAVAGSYVGNFILKKLHTDLKQFHNPSSDKTKRIFQEYLGLDVTEGWSWANYEPEKARSTLNSWIGKRGDAVHRSKPFNNGSPVAHLIKRDELEKVIRFIKDLVKATDAYVDNNLSAGDRPQRVNYRHSATNTPHARPTVQVGWLIPIPSPSHPSLAIRPPASSICLRIAPTHGKNRPENRSHSPSRA